MGDGRWEMAVLLAAVLWDPTLCSSLALGAAAGPALFMSSQNDSEFNQLLAFASPLRFAVLYMRRNK